MLQSMGSQRVRHDLATEQQQQKVKIFLHCIVPKSISIFYCVKSANSPSTMHYEGRSTAVRIRSLTLRVGVYGILGKV